MAGSLAGWLAGWRAGLLACACECACECTCRKAYGLVCAVGGACECSVHMQESVLARMCCRRCVQVFVLSARAGSRVQSNNRS